MRCPECEIRNSVAANKCKACGHKFPRKPIALSVKIGAGVLVGAVAIWGVASALVPKYTDPELALERVANEVMAGPKSGNDAKRLKSDLDRAVFAVLDKHGDLPLPELMTVLQKRLPTAAFEVHITDLPRALRLVEVDTVLQASDYLVMKAKSGVKTFPVDGLEVFENGKIITDGAAPSLVLIGHSAGQAARRPQIKVMALMPDDVSDRSSQSVPEIKGDGSAIFLKNDRDIQVDVSLYSQGVAEGLFTSSNPNPVVQDETVRYVLDWKDHKYTLRQGQPQGKLMPLYAMALALTKPADAAKYEQYIGQSGVALVKELTAKQPLARPEFSIVKAQTSGGRKSRRRRSEGREVYILTNATKAIEIELQQKSHWVVANAALKDLNEAAAIAQSTPQTPVTTTAAPPQSPKPSNTPNNTVEGTQGKVTIKTLDQYVESVGSEKTTETAKKSEETTKEKTAATITKVVKEPEKPRETPSTTIASATTETPSTSMTSSTPTRSRGSAKPPPDGEEKVSSAEGAQVSQSLSGNHVRVRRGPSMEYRTLTEASAGDKIEFLGKKNGWYRVRVNGVEGYLNGGFVSSSTSAGSNASNSNSSNLNASSNSSSTSSREERRRSRRVAASNSRRSSSSTTATTKKREPEASEPPQFVP